MPHPHYLGNRQRVIDHLLGGLLLELGRVLFRFPRHSFPVPFRMRSYWIPVRQVIGTSDTVMLLPGQQVACDFDADNPGQWMTHCHNLYHATESGMMAVLGYQA
jgi:FtsP/CotA-like multicopper oxidase with cupredoxin domain